MAMVVVDDSCLQANSQPKSRGLVWGSTAAWRCSSFIKWTEWTLAMTLWSWWQHYKHCHGYYYYYYYYCRVWQWKNLHLAKLWAWGVLFFDSTGIFTCCLNQAYKSTTPQQEKTETVATAITQCWNLHSLHAGIVLSVVGLLLLLDLQMSAGNHLDVFKH